MHEQVHTDLSKADKKRLCGILDCQRLSPEVRAHAVKNELLPLRTVVQLLYFEQDHHKTKRSDGKLLALDLEKKMVIKGDIEETRSEKARGIKDASSSSGKVDLDPKKIIRRTRSKSEHGVKK